MEKIKFKEYSIVLQEIPNEISLVFTVTGCPLACKGCHSSYLWKKNNGIILTDLLFEDILNKYNHTISCVLFMGGEWYKDDLLNKLNMVKKFNIKTALYTGLTMEEIDKDIINDLDYIKVGRWIEQLGGLDSKKTNQKLIDLKKNKLLKGYGI